MTDINGPKVVVIGGGTDAGFTARIEKVSG